MAISKVIYGNKTLIDLSNDTVVADKLLKGYTAHGADGEPIDGACEFDVDSSGATATAPEVLNGKTFAKGGKIHTGSMPNNGAVSGSISERDEEYSVPQGYHDGSGKVGIDPTEKTKLVPENIRAGISILGIGGSMTGTEDAVAQTVDVVPTTSAQVIVPDTSQGFNYLAQVNVAAIPYVESENSAGGTTVTIG